MSEAARAGETLTDRPERADVLAERRRLELFADCSRCFGLCCVAPAFAVSADFAIDKDAGTPCPNLEPDFRCAIHDRLRPSGFAGCAAYDCFGAGQKVARVTFGGTDWKSDPRTASRMFAAFGVMRQLHELLWYLTEAHALRSARRLQPALRSAIDETEGLTRADADALAALDMPAYRQAVNALLLEASELARLDAWRDAWRDSRGDASGDARCDARRAPLDRRGADLVGADLRGADLRAASLRGATLVGADLRGADLRLADVTGADFRGANLGGADLTGTLFVTQSQVDSALGDAGTKLAPPLARPPHWGAPTG